MKEQTKKDWQEQRKRRSMITSPSQFETYELCKRKWWLSKVRKLDDGGSSKSEVFGTVLHAVCERFLIADDLGRDENGQPVDLYPEGWTKAYNRYTKELDGEITVGEAAHIKHLISKAIESGVLERRAHRQIEKNVHRTVIKLEPEDGGCHVQMTGFIDLCYNDEINDHKTSKSTKWFKSKESLKNNLQMLVYAKCIVDELRAKGTPLPPNITVRHNQFCTDPKNPVVRKTEVTLSIKEIDDYWENRIIPMAKEMSKYRDHASVWTDIPDPPDHSKSCNAYGGCPYRPICSGREDEKGYEARLDRRSKILDTTANLTVNGTPLERSQSMNLKEKLAAKKVANGGGQAPAVTSAKTTKTPPKSPPKAPPVNPPQQTASKPSSGGSNPKPAFDPKNLGEASDGTPLTLPPWVNPDDLASPNHGLGFNAQGSPCAISVAKAKRAKLPLPDQFDMEPMDDGTVILVHKETGEDFRCPLTLEAIKAAAESAPEEAQQAQSNEEALAQEEQAALGAEDSDDSEESKNKGGRPKKGFVLLINSVPVAGVGVAGRKGSGRYIWNLSEVMTALGEGIAEKDGKANFYEVNAFARRDALAACAAEVAEQIGTDVAYATGVTSGSDIKALVDALQPLAGLVIVGASS